MIKHIVNWKNSVNKLVKHTSCLTVERRNNDMIFYEWESLYYDPVVDNVINSYLILKEFSRYKSQGYNIKIRRKHGQN